MYLQTDQMIERLKFVQAGTMKPAFPEFYKNVLIEYRHEDHTIAVRSFNGQSHFMAILGEPEAKTVVPSKTNNNRFVFSPTKILQSFGKIKDQVFFHVNFEKREVVVKSRSAEARDIGEPCEHFLALPSFDSEEVVSIPVPELFAKCLRRVAWTTDSKAVDPACKGVYIETVHEEGESWLEFCATNRTIISVCRTSDNFDNVSGSGIVPYETAIAVADMIEKGKECDLWMDTDRLVVVAGDYTIVSTHIDAPMLNYKAVIESVTSSPFTTVRVNRAQILTACEFVSQFADPENHQIFLTFNETKIELRGHTKDKLKRGKYGIQYMGEAHGIELCIEHQRLQDSVKALETDELEIAFDPENPRAITIKPSDQGNLYSEVFTSLSVPPSQDQ